MLTPCVRGARYGGRSDSDAPLATLVPKRGAGAGAGGGGGSDSR